MNNPMTLIDPLGLYCGWDDGSYDANPEDGGASQGDCAAQGGTWYDGNSPNTDPAVDPFTIVVDTTVVEVVGTVDPIDPYDASIGGGGVGTGSYPDNLSWAWNQARMLLSDPNCAAFLKGVLSARGQPQDLNGLLANFDRANFVLSPVGFPHHWAGFTAHVESVGNTQTVYVDNQHAFDIVPVLMHEVLHTTAFGFSDQQLAAAVGKPVPGPEFSKPVINQASRNFSSAMNAACLAKP